MKKDPPRIRMFAGPNGSGKSTIKSVIRPDLLGKYLNPDEIENEIRQYDFLDLNQFQIATNKQEIHDFFSNSELLKKADLLDDAASITFSDNKISFFHSGVNAYFASVTADFIRRKLLDMNKSFTFETVMSSPDKVELMKEAQLKGYRTYLYYVATEDPSINISRVRCRVEMGGHSVPEDKITSRYYRSLDLLSSAVQNTNRSYIFDNTTHELIWLAEITDGHKLEIKSNHIPLWFKESLGKNFQL